METFLGKLAIKVRFDYIINWRPAWATDLSFSSIVTLYQIKHLELEWNLQVTMYNGNHKWNNFITPREKVFKKVLEI